MTTEKKLPQKARQLKAIRSKANLTQLQLASRIGVSLRTVTRWEQGTTDVPDGTFDKIEHALNKPRNVDRSFIIRGSNIDLGMEVLERLRKMDVLEAANKDLEQKVEAYRIKYGDLETL